VFRSGNSQEVRIPAALRLFCSEVTIRRDGAALVIEPMAAHGWPAGYFDSMEAGSTVQRMPQPPMPAIRRLDDPR
jgi:virulence-associated protein VagC